MTTAKSPITIARGWWFRACKEAGLDEDARRAIQARICGKDSASDMTVRDFNACVDDLKQRKLWKPKKPQGAATYRKPSGKAHVKKVFAIWGDMCRSGIPETPTRAALVAFVLRMTGLDDPEWMSVEQGAKVTEALKAWRKRVGGDS
jgi:Protein of unknown function (DUF1018)